MSVRRLVLLGVVLALFSGCGDDAPGEDAYADLVPQLDMALSVLSHGLVCPGATVVEEEFDPLEVGSLEEHGQRLPAALVSSSSMRLVEAGERTRVATWSDAGARPVAMLVMAELEGGEYALRRIRYCEG